MLPKLPEQEGASVAIALVAIAIVFNAQALRERACVTLTAAVVVVVVAVQWPILLPQWLIPTAQAEERNSSDKCNSAKLRWRRAGCAYMHTNRQRKRGQEHWRQ